MLGDKLFNFKRGVAFEIFDELKEFKALNEFIEQNSLILRLLEMLLVKF